MLAADAALLELGYALRGAGYRFICPTPATQARVLKRPHNPKSADLRDIFGWNRIFSQEALPEPLFRLLDTASALHADSGGFRCGIRFSTLDDFLFVHSGFPTAEIDAVFFGPDTYRFVSAIRCARALFPAFTPLRILDIGAGTGAGGIAANRIFGNSARLLLTDVNSKALRYAAINAHLNSATNVELRQSDVFDNVSEAPDLIIANPPYLVDAAARTYRDGGGRWGTDLSVRILEAALSRLPKGGVLILYTGSPIVRGNDVFLAEARPVLESAKISYRYFEMDPDVFGKELESAPYDEADRIAAVALIAQKDTADAS